MTKAVLKDGVFRPIGPLPADWIDGTEVELTKSPSTRGGLDTDEWMDAVERAVAEIDPEDAQILEEAIAEIRAEAKELAAKRQDVMGLFILDTNHLSKTISPVSHLRDRIRSKKRDGHLIGTCWPVLCELEAGIIRTKRPERNRRALNHVLNEVRIWPVDWDVVRENGRLSVRAQSIGRILSHVDLNLAAIASIRGATILTSDKDFTAFPEIDVESWI